MENREKLAREWATSTLPHGDMRVRAAIEHIIATTTPPTMAEIEWDDKHFLTGATNKNGEDNIMLGVESCDVITLPLNGQPAMYAYAPGDLTPNGKRYKIVEATLSPGEKVGPEQGKHPKILRTVEDYVNAPLDTIAAIDGCHPITKTMGGWERPDGDMLTNKEAAEHAVAERKVLRWGKKK